MHRLKPSGLAFAKFFLGTVGLLAGLISFFAAGPALESRYWPVLGKLEFTKVESVTDNTSIVRVRFTKERDCEYMGIAWYYGSSPGISERVSMIPIRDPEDTSSPNRIVGMQSAGPWRLAIPAGEVSTKSYVVAYHRCHPFWTTSTKFYP